MASSAQKIQFKQGGSVAEEVEGSSGGGKKKLIIIAVVLLLIIGAAATFFFIMFSDEKGKFEGTPDDVKKEASVEAPVQRVEGQFHENPLFSEAIKITVNLKDGKRFLRVSMIIGLVDPKGLNFLNSRFPLVRDVIISTLQNKTTKELRKPQGIDRLKRTLVRKLNTTVFTETFINESETGDRSPIKKILFEEFLLQ